MQFDGRELVGQIPYAAIRLFVSLSDHEYVMEFYYNGRLINCVVKKYNSEAHAYSAVVDELKPLFGIAKNQTKIISVAASIIGGSLQAIGSTKLFARSPLFLQSGAPMVQRFVERHLSELDDKEIEFFRKDIAHLMVFKIVCGIRNRTQTKIKIRLLLPTPENITQVPAPATVISTTEGEIDFFILDFANRNSIISKIASERFFKGFTISSVLREMFGEVNKTRIRHKVEDIINAVDPDLIAIGNVIFQNISVFLA